MSNVIEINDNTLINLDNVNSVTKNNAKNGGRPMLVIQYIDSVGINIAFDDHKSMSVAYNKIKSSNNK